MTSHKVKSHRRDFTGRAIKQIPVALHSGGALTAFRRSTRDCNRRDRPLSRNDLPQAFLTASNRQFAWFKPSQQAMKNFLGF